MAKVMRDQNGREEPVYMKRERYCGTEVEGKSVYIYKKEKRQPESLQDLMGAIVKVSFAALASVPAKGTG